MSRRRKTRLIRSIAGWVINLRNVYQVMVSADARYGPVFSAGIAQTVWRRLREAGYQHHSRAEVVLLGWSGGAQMAAGAAWYLGGAGVRVSLISLGGIFSADPGLQRCRSIHHLVGSRDWQARWFAPMVFPGRRRLARHSPWARARAEGRVQERFIGPFKHVGGGSYLSGRRQPDGRTCSRVTSAAVAGVIADEGWAEPDPKWDPLHRAGRVHIDGR